VPTELITPCLDELAAAEGVVREAMPASALSAQAEAVPQVPAVYLSPFYQAERSVAHALLRLLAARDRGQRTPHQRVATARPDRLRRLLL
jgi:exodeoxyribonuclease V alpha subunit